MSSAEFLSRLGIFSRRNFFSDDMCKTIISSIRSGTAQQATVGNDEGVYVVDETARRVSQIEVRDEILKLVSGPLQDLKPQLEDHFQVKLSYYQKPCFLSYRTGDYYVPHRDQRRDEGSHSSSREREVSVVIFLNPPSEIESQDSYGGGELTFYGLIKAPGTEARGVPLVAEQGLLVGFSSDLIHEVKPVTHGERFTMVTWYASTAGQRNADVPAGSN